MAKVLLWYTLERLVSIPAGIFISLHELLIRRVLESLERAEGRHGLVDMDAFRRRVQEGDRDGAEK